MAEFNGKCVFCGATDIDIPHVSACAVKYAKEKLSLRDIAVFSQLMRTVLVVKTYEAASKEEQSLMCVCVLCDEFDFIRTIHPICACCSGLYTTVRASKYIENLLAKKL